jgi:hypothetical protein
LALNQNKGVDFDEVSPTIKLGSIRIALGLVANINQQDNPLVL